MYLEKTKSLSQGDSCTPVFSVALFTISNPWKQPRCPPRDEWIKKTGCIYNRIVFSHKKEGNSAICNNTDGP